ncbi:MAG: hypothetical protein MUF86_13515 [Akkermansiaceae bacterium]|jgi:hypothetical protein|nr:hypothetical protein [Akkermansiaceae bacterium]MCU0778666.1 hypothetical protein [Akkermansiaceae bacterium]
MILHLLAAPALAAIVNTGTLTTTFSGPSASSVNTSSTATVDLSNLAGLTPGHDIIITFTTGDSLFWIGGFTAGEDDLTLNYQARLTLTAGTYTTQSNEAWTFGPVPWPGGDSVGYEFGPSPASFSLTVPWGTGLTNVSLTLTDLSSITGLNAVIDSSSMDLANATLTTTSSPVPEPSAVILGLLSATLLIRRRRPAEL